MQARDRGEGGSQARRPPPQACRVEEGGGLEWEGKGGRGFRKAYGGGGAQDRGGGDVETPGCCSGG